MKIEERILKYLKEEDNDDLDIEEIALEVFDIYERLDQDQRKKIDIFLNKYFKWTSKSKDLEGHVLKLNYKKALKLYNELLRLDI